MGQKWGPKMTPFLTPFLDPYFDPQNPGFGTLPVPPTSPMYYKGEPHIRGLRTPGPLMQYKGNPWIWGPGTPVPDPWSLGPWIPGSMAQQYSTAVLYC